MSTKSTNPAVKKGDKIILVKSGNGHPQLEGKILEVTTERKKESKPNFNVYNSDDGRNYPIYYTNPKDEFILADREFEAAYLKEKLQCLDQEKSEIKARIEFLEKYETEEDFVADKLDAILTAHAGSTKKSDRIQTIGSILKELKTSDFL